MHHTMTSSERFLAALSGSDMDRIPMYEILYWPQTLERWRKEGLPAGIEPQRYFDLDAIGFFSFDGSLGIPRQVLTDDENFQVACDGNGVYYRRSKHNYSTPSFVETTIHSAEDWHKYKQRLQAGKQRIPGEMRFDPITCLDTHCITFADYYDLCQAEGRFTVLTPVDPIWYALRLMGEEESLIAMAAEPDFIQMVVEDYALFNEQMLLLLMRQGYHFDAVWVFSDLCYKNGLLFSPQFFQERVMPTFKRYIDLCHEIGSKYIFHSDGNLAQLIPLLLEAQVDCVQPLEARAGNDICQLASQYGGQISFMGNINVDVLATTHDQIQAEISRKLECVIDSRRYIFHSDHSIPPEVSLENYAYAIQLAMQLGQYR